LEALERTLRILGHSDELNNDEKKSRFTMFYRGELRNFILYQLREGPKTSRQLAEILLRNEAKGVSDARLLSDVTRRITKSLRLMQASNFVARRKAEHGVHFVWSLEECSRSVR